MISYGVLTIYAALAVWAGLLVRGFMRGRYSTFLLWGIGLLLVLNVRYIIEGAPDAIAFFIGIYDVLDNLGAPDGAAALASCPDNGCTVWGDTYTNHPSWGVAFHERFTTGPDWRTNLLYGHIICNSVAFVLMHIQMLRPGGSPKGGSHKLLGKVTFGFLTVSVVCAVLLSAQHGDVGEYGGSWSTWGFYSMSAVVYSCAVMGVLAIRGGDAERHRVWMWRFAGSMWGSFWLFRVMLFVLGPILIEHEAAAILICIWLSAPLGVIIAEVMRRRLDDRALTGLPAE